MNSTFGFSPAIALPHRALLKLIATTATDTHTV